MVKNRGSDVELFVFSQIDRLGYRDSHFLLDPQKPASAD